MLYFCAVFIALINQRYLDMRKFLSLLCAVLVVLGANAVQTKFRKVADAKQIVANKAKAKKAIKAATNVTVSGIYFRFEEEDGDAYYELYNEDGSLGFVFDILVAEGDRDVVLGQEYTLDDMLAEYCLWYEPADPYFGDYSNFTACTFVKTQDGEGNVIINATATDTNGDEWVLSYDEATAPKAPQGGTFVADNVKGEYSSWYSDIQYFLTVSEENLKFSFDINLDEGVQDVESGKEYTIDDMNTTYCYIQFGATTKINFAAATFTKTVAEDGSYTVIGTIKDENGDNWTITAAKAAPTIVDYNLTLNGTVEVGSFYSQIDAANQDATVYVSLSYYGKLEDGATITDANLFYPTVILTEGDKKSTYDLQDVNLAVTYNEEAGAFILTGTMLGVNEDDDLDQINFTVSLTIAAAPAQGSKIEITLDMKNMTVAQTDSYWDIKGENEAATYFLEIRSLTADVDGVYTEENLDNHWTYIGTGDDNFFDIFDADVTVALSDGLLTVKGLMTFVNADTKDTIVATVDVAGIADGKTHLDYDASTTDFIVDFPNPTITLDYIASDGIILVNATNDDLTTISLEFNVASDAEGLAAGEYAINTTGDEGTLSAGDGIDDSNYLVGSFAGNRNASNQITTPIWWIVSGTVTVAENGVITIDAVNTYDKKIQCVVGTASTEGIEETLAEGKVVKLVRDNQVIILKGDKAFNVVGNRVK